MEKKIISKSFILIGVVMLLLIFSSLFLPSINKIEAYSGDGPDSNGLYFNLNGGTYEVSDCDEYAEEIIIPSSYNGKSVTKIGNNAFSSCYGLTKVTIPNTITSIGNYAFSECSMLKTITIPNSVGSIGSYAFYGCSNIKSITIPSGVASINDYAFDGCSRLTSITIPNTVTSIGREAFKDCEELTLINIPSSVANIGWGAFRNSGLISITIPYGVTKIINYTFYQCSNLTSVTIPSTVNNIGEYAFSYCSSLETITIPDSVTKIENSAFYDCTSLTEITIPSSVTSIGDYAFDGCSSLNKVVMKAITPPTITYRGIFNKTLPSTFKIFVPKASLSTYKAANNWSDHATKIYPETVAVNFEDGNGNTLSNQEIEYGSTATQPTTPTKFGYTFDNWYTGGNILWDFATTITEDMTLYAKWIANSYTVVFNANGGTGTMSNQGFTSGVSQELYENEFTKTGHHFIGWSLTSGGEIVYQNKESLNNLTIQDGEINLYAQWAPSTYTLTYNYQDATSGSSPSNKTVIYNSTYGELPTPEKTGHVFKGWYTLSSGGSKITSSSIVTTAGNHTIYSQ